MTVPAGLVELLAAEPLRSGVLTDFDGTLSEVVEEPSLAVPLPGVRGLLASLAGRLALVAVVSGRPLAFLVGSLGPEGRALALFGLYGSEGRPPERSSAPPSPVPGAQPAPARSLELDERWERALADAAAEAAGEVGGRREGTELEVKPGSFALHWRRAPQWAAALQAAAAAIAARHGLAARPARMAVEIVPPGHSDKGIVVQALAKDLVAACFIGDDLGDVAAFRALEALGAGGLRFARVAVDSTEAPPELLERADYVLDGPAGVRELLAALDERLAGR